MKPEQQSETYTTTETRDPSSGGRVKWSRPADFVWAGGASLLTALLLWLLFGASA